jgi:hypothetical protein
MCFPLGYEFAGIYPAIETTSEASRALHKSAVQLSLIFRFVSSL